MVFTKRFRKDEAEEPGKAKLPPPRVVDVGLFQRLCQIHGLPAPVAEYRFHPEREWRFDFAWPAYKVALEVDGGVGRGGRHTRRAGFIRDQEKRNEAAALGWLVVCRVTSNYEAASVYELLRRVLTAAGWGGRASQP